MAQMTKKLSTRIIQKHDLEVNWMKAVNFVPLHGEIIIYDIEVDADGNTLAMPSGRTKPYTFERLKIGDGITDINNLPFANSWSTMADDEEEITFCCGTAAEYIVAPAEVLEGSGQEYYTMAPSVLSFRSTAPLNELQNITVNGEVLDPSNYELEEGSTIVKLPIEYLKTLDTGSYDIAVESASKTAKGNFTVAAPELNEYGFYYNQPYFCDADVGPDWSGYFIYGVLSFNENGTACYIDIENTQITTIEVLYKDSTYSFSIDGIDFSGSFSPDGLSFVVSDVYLVDHFSGEEWHSSDVDISFTLDTEAAVSDSEYYYIRSTEATYDDQCNLLEEDTYNVFPIDKTKSIYGKIKNNINGITVAGLAKQAFLESSITEIELPKSIRSIRGEAFNRCTNLASITLPEGVTEVGAYAFNDCSNLAIINLPDSLRIISFDAFTGTAYYKTSTNWDNDILYIGKYVISSKQTISGTHTIKPGTKAIAEDAFSNPNNQLSEIILPEGLKYIAYNAFYCNQLKNITIPAGTFIEGMALDCPNLESITLLDGATAFHDAFYWCDNVTTLTLSPNVTIGSASTFGDAKISTLNFLGTKAQWETIKVTNSGWKSNFTTNIVHCTDGDLVI